MGSSSGILLATLSLAIPVALRLHTLFPPPPIPQPGSSRTPALAATETETSATRMCAVPREFGVERELVEGLLLQFPRPIRKHLFLFHRTMAHARARHLPLLSPNLVLEQPACTQRRPTRSLLPSWRCLADLRTRCSLLRSACTTPAIHDTHPRQHTPRSSPDLAAPRAPALFLPFPLRTSTHTHNPSPSYAPRTGAPARTSRTSRTRPPFGHFATSGREVVRGHG
ncbi:hypothetical protein C8J57DRAFT_1725273 [Mycena rebaudengoi]|nr:hypothetical protein C8J57DRAFT_1725273 [Mycena rebaudengoi]